MGDCRRRLGESTTQVRIIEIIEWAPQRGPRADGCDVVTSIDTIKVVGVDTETERSLLTSRWK